MGASTQWEPSQVRATPTLAHITADGENSSFVFIIWAVWSCCYLFKTRLPDTSLTARTPGGISKKYKGNTTSHSQVKLKSVYFDILKKLNIHLANSPHLWLHLFFKVSFHVWTQTCSPFACLLGSHFVFTRNKEGVWAVFETEKLLFPLLSPLITLAAR